MCMAAESARSDPRVASPHGTARTPRGVSARVRVVYVSALTPRYNGLRADRSSGCSFPDIRQFASAGPGGLIFVPGPHQLGDLSILHKINSIRTSSNKCSVAGGKRPFNRPLGHINFCARVRWPCCVDFCPRTPPSVCFINLA